MSWFYYENRSAIATRAGIKAKNSRGRFATTSWGERWEDLLGTGSRVSRARTYARKGQVVDLRIEPGEVQASIQGSRPFPYEGSIGVRSFSDSQWDQLVGQLQGRPALLTRLLDGELPDELDDLCRAQFNRSLVPSSTGELTFECSCPDWGDPCKHMAAVHLLITEQLDAEPWLVFLLRGIEREALRERLLSQQEEPAPEEAPAVRAEVVALPVDAAQFWCAEQPNTIELDYAARLPGSDAAIVEEVGEVAFWQAEISLRDALSPIYEAAARRGRVLLGERDDA